MALRLCHSAALTSFHCWQSNFLQLGRREDVHSYMQGLLAISGGFQNPFFRVASSEVTGQTSYCVLIAGNISVCSTERSTAHQRESVSSNKW